MNQKLVNVPIGTKIYDEKTKYLGTPISWIVVDKNRPEYPNNSVTLMSQNILTLKAFDGDEKYSSNLANIYSYSNINQWLNSKGNNWYKKTHDEDNPPNKYNVTCNPYIEEKGFLSNISENFLKNILDTKLNVTNFNESKSYPIVAKFFLPSVKELDSENRYYSEGNPFAYIKQNNRNKGALVTYDAYRQSDAFHTLNTNTYFPYWTRSANTIGYVLSISNANDISCEVTNNGFVGVRIVVNIKDSVQIEQKANTDVHKMIFNSPPSSPVLKPLRNIAAGKQILIQWSESSDPDSDSVNYTLRRKLDTDSYVNVYKGVNNYYYDTVPKGHNTVVYDVYATDSQDNISSSSNSGILPINNNEPPVINCNYSDLGEQTTYFTISYTPNDTESRNLEVKEYLDGNLRKTFSATAGTQYKFVINSDDWKTILNGRHTIKITAEDNDHAITEKLITFIKNTKEILFELSMPLTADSLVKRALVSANYKIPSGSVIKIEMCNNGFDSNPTWEDVTEKVKTKSKIFFANKTKTASKWGINIRVSVKRNGGVGDCYVSSISGNFD